MALTADCMGRRAWVARAGRGRPHAGILPRPGLVVKEKARERKVPAPLLPPAPGWSSPISACYPVRSSTAGRADGRKPTRARQTAATARGGRRPGGASPAARPDGRRHTDRHAGGAKTPAPRSPFHPGTRTVPVVRCPLRQASITRPFSRSARWKRSSPWMRCRDRWYSRLRAARYTSWSGVFGLRSRPQEPSPIAGHLGLPADHRGHARPWRGHGPPGAHFPPQLVE
jgi:hypothetical protein